jgi:hypothetical protein
VLLKEGFHLLSNTQEELTLKLVKNTFNMNETGSCYMLYCNRDGYRNGQEERKRVNMSNNAFKCEIILLSSLAKVFPDEQPIWQPECIVLSALKGETVSFQAAYTGEMNLKTTAEVLVISPIQDYIHVRSVTVPVGTACGRETDDNYLKKTSGVYPDVLRELKDGRTDIMPGKWKSLWIDIEVTDNMHPGSFPVEICLKTEEGILCSACTSITVYDAVLPKQKLIHTEWMHADCLADYYRVPVFSEEHWSILKNFLLEYVKRGCKRISGRVPRRLSYH